VNNPGIVRADYNLTPLSTLGANTAFNGLVSTASACGANVVRPATSTFEIGGRTGGGGAFNNAKIFSGQIAEIIHYDLDALSGGAADINKIESYLAVKYGLTLSNSGGGTNGDYTSSGGTTIWDASVGSGYHNNVIGIGRDENSSLQQKQSHQSDDATQIYIGSAIAASNLSNTGNFSTDGQFVMLGDNGGSLALNAGNTEYPGSLGITGRLDREWKITNTGFTGTFSLSILPSSLSYIARQIRVLIDDDGDFSNAIALYPFVSISGGRIILTGITNAMIAPGVTKYIAIAVGPVVASPGGVVDYAQLWTRADAGVITSGTNVSQWTNQATTISMTAQATMAVPSSSVSLGSNDFNYNPSITFNGASNQKLAGTFATPTVNPALMFAVVKKSNLPNVVYANPYSLGATGASGIAYNNILRGFGIDFSAGPCGFTANINGVPGIVRADYASTASITGANTAYNGLLSTSSTCSAGVITPTDGTFEIGGRTFGGQPGRIFSGQIAEVIHFDMDALSGGAADITKIESYLAIKYGLTLSNSGGGINGNYTSSGGTTVWTASTGSAYHSNVIGIGRDDASALLQKQSHQADDATRIYISAALAASNLSNTGSFSSDGQFVMMGSNGGALSNTGSTEYPAGIGGRITREWKLTNTAFAGTFSLDIRPASTCNNTGFRLLVDDDGDFSNGASIYSSADGLTFTNAGGVITIAGISTGMIPANSTKYITLATAVAVSPDQTICSNTAPADLSIIGYTGTVNKWQYSTAVNFISPVDIASSASLTLTGAQAGSLTQTTYFRAVVTDVLCTTVNSSALTVTIDPVSAGGVPTSAQQICSGSSPLDLTLAVQIGNVTKWQYSTAADFISPVDIASSASLTLTGAQIGNLTQTTYFRAVVKSGVCSVANSATVTVTVDPVSAGGVPTAAQTICSATSPADLTLGGQIGNTAKWQYSVNADFSGATDISSSNAATLTSGLIGNLNQTTYFRAIVQSGVCAAVNSATVTVTVDPVSVGGTTTAAQTLCAGVSPADLTLGAQTGSIIKWQYSVNADFSGAVDIASSNGTTLTSGQIGNLNQTTYFWAIVQSGVCAAVNSGTVTVTVDPVSAGGTPSPAQTICTGTSPANLTLGGQTGSVMKWQYSVNADFSGAVDIVSSNATTLTGGQVGNLSQTTYFRAMVQSGVCNVVPSSAITITVNAVSVGGTPIFCANHLFGHFTGKSYTGRANGQCNQMAVFNCC
jgi:hypothetical protein